MTRRVVVRLSDSDLAALDAAIARGQFASRSEALRTGLRLVLHEEHQRQVSEAWVGELGLAALAAFDKAEGGPPL